MRVTDDSNKVLNAEYSVEEDKNRLALILESAGGRTRSSDPRNADYRFALTLLLARLKERQAILLDALVDSAYTRRRGIPERDRRLIALPVRLADLDDVDTLRAELTSAQGRIGQLAGASKAGNSSKRIRLIMEVPGYDPGDAGRLEIELAAPRPIIAGGELAGIIYVDSERRVRALAGTGLRTETLTAEDVLEALEGLHMQEGPDGLAKRHQPLTLLWAIGRARQGKQPLAPWPVARTEIGELIRRFGREADAANPYLPFLALNRTGLWTLTSDPPRRGTGPDARRRWLNNTKTVVAGGLTQPFYDLMTETEAATKVVARLLDTYFSDVDADSLLQAAGLQDLAAGLTSRLGPDIDGPEKEEQRAAEALLRALASDSTVVEPEASHVESTQYERKAGNVTVWRGEAQLVARYRRTLPEAHAKRIRLAVGWTDLYRVNEADLIEAKVSARHRYVREALGQLLDYAAHCTLPVNRLTALFPTAPPPSDVRLLHAYGIDCLYWAGGDVFPRLEAPAEARQRTAAAWSSLSRP